MNDKTKKVTIKKEQNNNVSKLETFRRLRNNSKNKTKLTMAIATNTDEMVNDGIFLYNSVKINTKKGAI